MKQREHAATGNYLDLYKKPLPSSRGGTLYRAFSYPTKISAEAIALFIAIHTKPGDTVLDTFAGSGTTGLAAILCAKPTQEMKRLAAARDLSVSWGARNVVLYELSVLGAFVSENLCNPPDPDRFVEYANKLISEVEQECGFLYDADDDSGKTGKIRYSIWTDFYLCPNCGKEVSFWESAVTVKPANIANVCCCPKCKHEFKKEDAKFVTEKVYDPILGKRVNQRKRRIAMIFGQTDGVHWSRRATPSDESQYKMAGEIDVPSSIPNVEIEWGDLLRSGYHFGISHVHHFYSLRNLIVTGMIFDKIKTYPIEIQSALKFLALSYNASHSTIMTRVVVKNGQEDFVLTGAQTGVLYVSSLPVEKNIFEGLKRKIKTISEAFHIANGFEGNIDVINASSTALKLDDKSIDYVFTDPPFGDFIPYAEINLINESWLGKLTESEQEIIVSQAQGKTVNTYGELMAKVFQEIARVSKPSAKATVIFHSAKSAVWQALINAFRQASLFVETSSVLDKLQASFKQTNSLISVQGDPVILLSKENRAKEKSLPSRDMQATLDHLIKEATADGNLAGLNERRLYSIYVGYCLENNVPAPVDARIFYSAARLQLQAYG